MISSALLFCVIALALFLLWRLIGHRFGGGDLITLDDYPNGGRRRTFVNALYRVRARPDKLIKRPRGKSSLTEYKDREIGIYPSDRAQIIATALACRGAGVDVREAVLQTRTIRVRVDVEMSDDELARRIERPLTDARLAVLGVPPSPLPTKPKCRSCSVRHRCAHRAV